MRYNKNSERKQRCEGSQSEAPFRGSPIKPQ